MDDIDHAQEMGEKYPAASIAATIARSMSTGASRMDCIDCEEEIPEGRRIAVPGCRRCVNCQEIFES